METSLAEKTCAEFTEKLASKAPIPGGGGAGALAAALAAALCAMAANLTLGKKKYASFEADLLRTVEEAETLRLRFLALIDRDAENFEPLSLAYSSGDPELLRTAALKACEAPMEILEGCAKAISLLEELQGKCSLLLLSDLGCSAVNALAAMEAAAMNIYVNTRMLPGDPEAQVLAARADELLTAACPRAQTLANGVMEFLKAPKGY